MGDTSPIRDKDDRRHLELKLYSYIRNLTTTRLNMKVFAYNNDISLAAASYLLSECRRKYGVEKFPYVRDNKIVPIDPQQLSTLMKDGYDIHTVAYRLGVKYSTLCKRLTELRHEYGVDLFPHFKRVEKRRKVRMLALDNPRNVAIMEGLQNGHTYTDIANRLNVKRTTVRSYASKLRKKYGIEQFPYLEQEEMNNNERIRTSTQSVCAELS